MAIIHHRCTICGHAIPDHDVKRDDAYPFARHEGAGPCRRTDHCECAEAMPRPVEGGDHLGRAGRPITKVRQPDKLNGASPLRTCGCADCRALYTELTGQDTTELTSNPA